MAKEKFKLKAGQWVEERLYRGRPPGSQQPSGGHVIIGTTVDGKPHLSDPIPFDDVDLPAVDDALLAEQQASVASLSRTVKEEQDARKSERAADRKLREEEDAAREKSAKDERDARKAERAAYEKAVKDERDARVESTARFDARVAELEKELKDARDVIALVGDHDAVQRHVRKRRLAELEGRHKSEERELSELRAAARRDAEGNG